MAQLTVGPCADAEVLAGLQHATITVAYREYFPDSPRGGTGASFPGWGNGFRPGRSS